MAATSKHYGDVYRWIERIIDSCTQPSQEIVARKLITQFRDNLKESGEVDWDTAYTMAQSLRDRLQDRVWERGGRTLLTD